MAMSIMLCQICRINLRLRTTAATLPTTNATSHNNIAPFVTDIISLAKQNNNFRQDIKTANHTQVVLMSLKPGEDIGLEVHKKIDQLLIFVKVLAKPILVGKSFL